MAHGLELGDDLRVDAVFEAHGAAAAAVGDAEARGVDAVLGVQTVVLRRWGGGGDDGKEVGMVVGRVGEEGAKGISGGWGERNGMSECVH